MGRGVISYRRKVKIVFWGTPNFAVPILQSLLDSKHEVIAVVTQPDKRRNRGSKLNSSPVKELANKNSIKVITPKNIKSEKDILSEIEFTNADIFIVVAFGQILPKEILRKPSLGCWNIHASLLPKWRGAAPIQRSILNGDKETGVGIMLMEEELDTGPILLEKKIDIGILSNLQRVTKDLQDISCIALKEALEIIESSGINKELNLESKLKLTSQSLLNRNLCYAKMINKSELAINWNEKSIDIHRKVMGFSPSVFTFYKAKRIKISSTVPLEYNLKPVLKNYIDLIEKYSVKNGRPGEIIGIEKGIGIIVKTKSSAIIVQNGQVEGKRLVSSDVLIQQLSFSVGEEFS